MQRMPPGEDEQDEQLEDLPEDSQEMYPPRIRRRTPTGYAGNTQRQPPEYGEDAYPHRPKTLRASRNTHRLTAPPEEQQEQQHPAEQRRPPERQARLARLARQPRQTPPAPTAKRPAPAQRRPYRAPIMEDEAYEGDMPEEHVRPFQRPHSRSGYAPQTRRPLSRPMSDDGALPMSARRRAPGAAAPPRPRPRPAHARHTERPLLTRFLEWEHRRTLLVVASLAIIGIILIPVLASTLFFAARSNGSVIIPGSGNAQTTQNGQTGISANPPAPHELVIIPSDTDHPPPAVFATSAYLLDADTGVTLYAHNPFLHLPMMSTTKLMTALIAVEKGNPDQIITITPAIEHDIKQLSADSTLFGMKQGERYTLRDLLYGLLLPSGNDAAVAIADGLDGSIPRFVADMNLRAKQLGLYDTHYVNPHGLLGTGQYSSAHDLAFLGRYALNVPLIHQISAAEQYHIPKTASHQEHFLFNGNQFLWWYPGVDGGKPGYDGASNFVQVISVTRNHHHLIGVTMHTNDWWTDMRDLMNWGFDNFTWVSPYLVDLQHPIPYDTLWNFFVKDKKENTIPTADRGRYYIFTGYAISGPIMTYFDKSGGLKKFGFPTAMPKVPNAQTISQQFEHATIQCNLTTKQCQTV